MSKTSVSLNKAHITTYAVRAVKNVGKKNYLNRTPIQQMFLLKKVKIFIKINMTIL